MDFTSSSFIIVVDSQEAETTLREAFGRITEVAPFRSDRIDGISTEFGLIVAITVPLIAAIKEILLKLINNRKNRQRFTIRYKELEIIDPSEDILDKILRRIEEDMK
jgi:hypothetical protein